MAVCLFIFSDLFFTKARIDDTVGGDNVGYELGKKHAEFITKYAAIDVPKRLETVLKLTELLGT